MIATTNRHPRLDFAAPVVALAALALVAFSALEIGADDRPGSTAVISWEAPGDDDLTGVATRYQVRFRIVPLAPGGDTLAYWNAGTVVGGAPAPGWPGTTDSLVVTGLDPSVSYYFIVRAADEVPNWSGFSNFVVKPAVPDQVAPAPIDDLLSNPGNALKTAGTDTLHTGSGATPPR